MAAIAILITSLALQLTAAYLALRLSWIAKKSLAWVLIFMAILLMALRRGIILYHLILGGLPHPLDVTGEVIALAISVLMVVGIAWIAPIFLSLRHSEEAMRLNDARLEALWELSQMTGATLQEITDFALEGGVRLTKSSMGYLAFMNEDESVLTMHSWSKGAMEECAIIDKPIVYPLATTGLWGEAVRRRQPVITNDYAAPSPHKKGYPSGHVRVMRHMNVPVLDGDRIVAVAGVGNKEEAYDESDVRQLTLLMQGMWWLIKRKRTQDALTAEVERGHLLQAKLVQTSMDGIVVNDMEGNILIFNEGASRILGYASDEAVGKFNVNRLYQPHQAHEIKKRIYSPEYGGVGVLDNYETTAVHKSGALVPIWLAARILYENGRETAIVGYFRDLRERKRLEEELLRHERLASLGKMVAHISHEIKNPLTVIGGFAQQLERLASMPREAGHKLRLIHEEVLRLEKFLADLSSFTRCAPSQKNPGDVAALIREVGDLMQDSFKEKGVIFLVQAEEIPLFPFDAGQIRQVLVNIFKNAIEAMPQGGELAVTAQVKENLAELTIRDTGQGIAPDQLQQLFTPFFSTKEKGTGLGLVISRGIIEQHRGDIRIDSQPGRGTTCTIRLPLDTE